MSTGGQIEKKTQERVVKLFPVRRPEHAGQHPKVEEDLLRTFLRDRPSYDPTLVTRSLHLLTQAAGDTSKSLYDRNRAVYAPFLDLRRTSSPPPMTSPRSSSPTSASSSRT